MTELEELQELSSLTPAERQFKSFIERAKSVAFIGGTEFEIKTYSHAFFSERLANAPENAEAFNGKSKNEVIDEMYNTQYKVIDMFREKGFTVTETEASHIIQTPGPNTSPMEFMEMEREVKFGEKEVIISWAKNAKPNIEIFK